MTKKYKIALIVGHEVNGKDKGAVNYKGEPESTFNYRICQKIVKQLAKYQSMQITIFKRDGIGVRGVAKQVAAFNPDLSIEFHFNSFHKAAKGCEALALQTEPESIRFADLITDIISERLHIQERNKNGVLALNLTSRGYWNLKHLANSATKDFPKIIVEPVFANIKTFESSFFFENEDLYVNAVIWAIKSHFGIGAHKALEKQNIEVVQPLETKNPLKLMTALIDSWRSY